MEWFLCLYPAKQHYSHKYLLNQKRIRERDQAAEILEIKIERNTLGKADPLTVRKGREVEAQEENIIEEMTKDEVQK